MFVRVAAIWLSVSFGIAAVAQGDKPSREDRVREFLTELKDPDAARRRDAAIGLGFMRKDAQSAVHPLMEALHDPDASVQKAAVQALGSIGPSAAEAAPVLVERLLSSSGYDAQQIDLALRGIGPACIPPLAKVLSSGDEMAALAVIPVLGRLGDEAAAPLAPFIRDKRSNVRQAAADALRTAGESGAKVLVGAMSDPDRAIVRLVVGTFARPGYTPLDALPELVKRLHDPEPDIRADAARAVGPVVDDSSVQPLIEAVGDPDGHVRFAAVEAFGEVVTYGRCADKAHDIQQALVRVLADPDPHVKEKALYALMFLGGDGDEVIVHAKELLKDPDAHVRLGAVSWVASQGHGAREAVSLLAQALKDADGSVRAGAAGCLGGMKSDAAQFAAEIGKLLHDPDPQVCKAASGALNQLGSFARGALPALAAAAKSGNKEIKTETFETLRQIGAEAVPVLVQSLREDPASRGYVLWMFQEMGPPAEAAVPAIAELLKDSDPKTRDAAARALEPIGPKAGGALAALSQALQDDDKQVRAHVAGALCSLGPKAIEAAPALVALLHDKEYEVQFSTAMALGKLGSGITPFLAPMIRDPDARVRRVAVVALDSLVRQRCAGEALPLILSAVEDGDPDVRTSALQLVAQLGLAPGMDSAALKRELADKDGAARLAAAGALIRIGDEDGLRTALQGIDSSNKEEEMFALTALACASPRSKALLPKFMELLDRPKVEVRLAALTAIYRLGPEARPALDKLVALMKDPNLAIHLLAAATVWTLGEHRDEAIHVVLESLFGEGDLTAGAIGSGLLLGGGELALALVPGLESAAASPDAQRRGQAICMLSSMGDSAREALPVLLVRAYGDPKENMPNATAAAQAVQRICLEPHEAVPVLMRALKDPDRLIRGCSAWQLGQFGSAARESLSELKELLKDGDPSVRKAAAEAIDRIGR